MGKKKHIKAEPKQEGTPVLVIPRMHKLLEFPAGWDRASLSEDAINAIRDYLREKTGAYEIDTEIHTTSARIERNPRSRITALFFAQTVQNGELVTEGQTIPARKGQLVVLPAGADFRIKYTPNEREIIEFTF